MALSAINRLLDVRAVDNTGATPSPYKPMPLPTPGITADALGACQSAAGALRLEVCVNNMPGTHG